eukprot:CAMPEP_0113957330 /NCGR_PEP_ID=MMETSP0011_2-20120614/2709_1 /TAXON_ID=101924 /ORGANISM="Rhodosorus marinus" /LENGTH=1014 /DNA_ID=CAMNT_0000967879 /DNA_START=386 /DNA_END=3430 /DNA_ORIENTATION=+ /assembly_acc=CAM_ASM_000156
MRNASSSIYLELKNLLPGLESMDSKQRKESLLDYAQRSRHLVIRLLALLRWSSKYADLTMKADHGSTTASIREEAYEATSNKLWACAQSCKKQPLSYPDVATATDVLVSGLPMSLPAAIGNVLDIRLDSTQEAKDVSLMKLKYLTHSFVKACLPLSSPGLDLLTKDNGDDATEVAIGFAGLWRATVLLESMAVENANLRMNSLEILVASKNREGNDRDTGKDFSVQQLYLLKRLCEDRMKIVLHCMGKEERRDPVASVRSMLIAVRNIVVDEICIPFVFERLQLEARELAARTGYGLSVVEGGKRISDEDTCVTLTYWEKSYYSGKITFESSRAKGRENGHVGMKPESNHSFRNDNTCLFTVRHEPQLANVLKLDITRLDLNCLDLETILRRTLQTRLYSRLVQLRNMILANKIANLREQDLKVIVSEQTLSVSLIIFLRNTATGMEFRCSQKTGALRVRPFGVAAMAVANKTEESGLWQGENHFETFAVEATTAMLAIVQVTRRLQLEAAATAMCVLDVGATRTLPPGTAWVAASSPADPPTSQLVPPFAPLERRAPRRFLTLSEPPRKENAKGTGSPVENGSKPKQRLTYASTSDGQVFIQEGAFPEGENRYSGSAAAAAAWAVAREAVERRLRRDSLLRAFSATSVAYPASSWAPHGQNDEPDLDMQTTSRTLLRVKCEPLPVQKAELVLRGNNAWQIRLSLLPAIFDSTDGVQGDDGSAREASWNVGLSCVDSILTFTYPSANAPAVRSFFRDLTRARTAAALARGVPPSNLYTVIRRSPVRLIVAINPDGTVSAGQPPAHRNSNACTVTVEYVYSKGNSGGFSVTFSPSKLTFRQLEPLIEEMLDASGGSVGTVLAGLLERACPIAAAADASVRDRGQGRVRFVTALRVRAIFMGVQRPARGARSNSQPQNTTHAVDVDARNGGGIAKIIDVGRATAIMTAQSFANRGGPHHRGKFAPVPMWDEIVEQLSRSNKATSICANSTVFLKMEFLEEFLGSLVQSTKSEPRRI